MLIDTLGLTTPQESALQKNQEKKYLSFMEKSNYDGGVWKREALAKYI